LNVHYFVFNRKFCNQKNGIVMSLLSPIVTNYFMAGFEQHALNTASKETMLLVQVCGWHFCDLATWNGRIRKVSVTP
jgi:hypothetical protein